MFKRIDLVETAIVLLNKGMRVKFYQLDNMKKELPHFDALEDTFALLKEEVRELEEELALSKNCKTPEEYIDWVRRVQYEIADVANFCAILMMSMEIRR